MEVRIEPLDIRLTQPFSYYLGTLDSLPYAEVIISDGNGNVGRGEVACSLDINGELQDAIPLYAPAISAILARRTIASMADIAGAMEELRLHIAHNTALKCGVEQALFGLLSARLGTPVAELIGAKWRPVKIQGGIPYQSDSAAYEQRIVAVLQKHPERVKFKVGKDLENERRAIEVIHGKAPSVQICVDANQAFNAKQAADFLGSIRAPLVWAEQMVAKDDIDGWRELRSLTRVPLMADESVHTPADALLYASLGLVDFINIKLAKCGGFFEGWKIERIASAHGIKVALGSMLHGEAGLRYNLAFGFTRSFVALDFDNYFNLADRIGPDLIDSGTYEIARSVVE